jgi:hypothetical protein
MGYVINVLVDVKIVIIMEYVLHVFHNIIY